LARGQCYFLAFAETNPTSWIDQNGKIGIFLLGYFLLFETQKLATGHYYFSGICWNTPETNCIN
jgi:hypothetical protein